MKTRIILTMSLLVAIVTISDTKAYGQELPKPQVAFVGKKDTVTSGGTPSTLFRLSLVNRAAYSKELFSAAPDLPPCGKTSAAWRAWIKIHDKQTDKALYAYCGESGIPDPLSSLSFLVPKGTEPPKEVYITITDRKSNSKVTSNGVAIPPPMMSNVGTAGPGTLKALFDLSMRDALYFTGAKNDKIDTKNDRYVTKGGTMELRASEALSCGGGQCEFNIGFIGFRSGNTAGAITSYGLLQVENGSNAGDNIHFAAGETNKQRVIPLKLRMGLNRVTFTIDPYKKTEETNEANNSITVSFNVLAAGKR
jgi:hypothetical protein